MQLTEEQKEKNRETNAKILKYGCLPIAIFFILVCVLVSDKGDKKKTASEASNINTKELNLKQKLENSLKGIEDNSDYLNKITTKEEVIISASMFGAYANMIESSKKGNEEERKLGSQLEKKVQSKQQKEFPLLRKKYAQIIKNKLWEEDIDVELSGTGNTTLTFTAGIFAKNKNIQEAQNTLQEVLNLLRFKTTRYKWYKNSDEFTYYTLETPKDKEIYNK